MSETTPEIAPQPFALAVQRGDVRRKREDREDPPILAGRTWRLLQDNALGARALLALPDKSIDHFICDPPYSEHTHSKQRSGSTLPDTRASKGTRGGQYTGSACISRARELGFEHLSAATRNGMARQMARLVRRWCAIFTDEESAHLWRESLERAGLEYIRTARWIKLGSTPQFTGDRPATGDEAIVLAHPPGMKRWNGGGRNAIYTVPIVLNRSGDEPRLHTAQKPLALMEAILRDFTDPGDLVCDPFAGSATTLVAAVRSGRRALGFERDKAIHAVALARMGVIREQLSLLGSLEGATL